KRSSATERPPTSRWRQERWWQIDVRKGCDQQSSGSSNIRSLPMADQNVAMMQSVFSKLEGIMSVSGPSSFPGHGFLVLENPGIFISPNLQMTNPDHQYLLSKEMNKACYPNWIWEDSGINVDSIYSSVLRDKELPIVELSGEQKQELSEAKDYLHNVLGGPSK